MFKDIKQTLNIIWQAFKLFVTISTQVVFSKKQLIIQKLNEILNLKEAIT
jgi:hypothetical protein